MIIETIFPRQPVQYVLALWQATLAIRANRAVIVYRAP